MYPDPWPAVFLSGQASSWLETTGRRNEGTPLGLCRARSVSHTARIVQKSDRGKTGMEFLTSRDPANDVGVWTYGVAYKPLFNVSLKLDYSDFETRGDSGVDQFSFSVGYLF